MVNCDDGGGEKKALRLVRPDADDLWTAEDVATYLKVSTKTVARLTTKGKLPSIIVCDRLRRYRPAAVKAWALAQESK